MKSWFAAGVAVALVIPAVSQAAETKRADFGTTADGRKVEAITLTNRRGMRATVISWGAILQSVVVPDRNGRAGEVSLGYDNMDGYIKAPNYFGATVGRYANRIKEGKFSIDGRRYTLAINNRPNALHGGPTGFDKRLWTVTKVTNGPTASVVLSYTSADGEEGYPGQLTVNATYSLNERNELSVEYTATTDKPTIVNITNHSFFNLAGEGAPSSIYDHVMTIPADAITPVDRTLIPTGELRPVAGTPFDFRTPRVIGDRIRDAKDQQIVFGQGYDHNFVIGRDVRQLSGRHRRRPFRPRLSPGRRHRHGAAGVSGHPEPAGVRFGAAEPGRDLSQHHRLSLLDHRGRGSPPVSTTNTGAGAWRRGGSG
jgi:aldose 1-epimerase